MVRHRRRLWLPVLMLLLSHSGYASESILQKQANAAISLMTFTVTPDITASNLSINDNSSGKTDLLLSQFGGGATLDDEYPIYLEGNVGFSRYDPSFLIRDEGEGEGVEIPTRWNTLSVSAGLGWDMRVYSDWVLRPIVNVALGTVASDIRIADWIFDQYRTTDNSFLDSGRLNTFDLGGALMLDYESYSDKQDIDVEMRYSYIHLQSFGSTSTLVKGEANAENLGLYLRRRAPTGLELLSRPLRYVLEGARTEYFGTQRGMLGFNALNSLGLGVEVDSSKYDIWITRTRLVGRYMFGENTSGYSIGLAVSF